jgi:ATP-dependent Clp protease ATP-binding subunit ClpA
MTDPSTDAGDGPLVAITERYKPEKVYLFYTKEMYDRELREGDIFQDAFITKGIDVRIIKLKNDKFVADDPCNQQKLFSVYSELIGMIIEENEGCEVLLNVTSGTIEMRLALILISSIHNETKLVQSVKHGGGFYIRAFDSRTIDAFIAEIRLSTLIDCYDYFGAYQMIKKDVDKLFQETTGQIVTHAYYRFIENKNAAKKVLSDTGLEYTITAKIPPAFTADDGHLLLNLRFLIESYLVFKYRAKVNDLSAMLSYSRALSEYLALMYINFKFYDHFSSVTDDEDDPRYSNSKTRELLLRIRNLLIRKSFLVYRTERTHKLENCVDIIHTYELTTHCPDNERMTHVFDELLIVTLEDCFSVTNRNKLMNIGIYTDDDQKKMIFSMIELILKSMTGISRYELYDDLNQMIKRSFFCYTSEKTISPEIDDEDDDLYDDSEDFEEPDDLTDEPETGADIPNIDIPEIDISEHEQPKKKTEVSRTTVVMSVKQFAIPNDLSSMLVDYTTLFAKEDRSNFRTEIINQILETLITKNKPNPLLVGPAGVGKTRIVEDLAYILNRHKCFYHKMLENVWVFELKLSNLVSGTDNRGDLEKRLTKLIEFLTANKEYIIIFIDEIHTLTSSSDMKKIAQELKPALARGNIRCIGATTLQESNRLLDDPAFNRRFARILVNEPTSEETVSILKNTLPEFARHHNVELDSLTLDENVLQMTVDIADRFTNAGSHRPDNAITLFDLTLSKAMSKKEKASDELPPITEELLCMTAKQIINGNEHQEPIDYEALKERLSAIKGQKDAIEKILKIIKTDDMGLFPRRKPLTMLFTGSSGVGKTEITKIIAEYVTHKKPIILNMAEYDDYPAINRIRGAELGYKDYDSASELVFDSLEANPYQFILLDEFEKSHRRVQRLFLGIFDEGMFTTGHGKTLDFSRAIIIATTNAANAVTNKKLGFTEDDDSTKERDKVKDLGKSFDPELVGRFEHIVNFNVLSADDYIEIVESLYRTETERINKTSRYKLPDKIDDETLQKLRKSYIKESGARQAKRVVEEYLETKINEVVTV